MKVEVKCEGRAFHPTEVIERDWGTFYIVYVGEGYVWVVAERKGREYEVSVEDRVPSIEKRIFVNDIEITNRRQKIPMQIPKPDTFMLDANNPFISYYAPLDVGCSFGVIANHHAQELPKYGYNVHRFTLEDLDYGNLTNDPIGVLHPLFFFAHYGLPLIRFNTFLNSHKKLAGFDLADTDKISPRMADLANKVDLIMVPSEFSQRVYIESGVTKPVEVVPHGLSSLFDSPKQTSESSDDNVNVLFFFLHSTLRKGADIVYTVMKRILKERKNVHLIVKGGDDPQLGFTHLPRTTIIRNWMQEDELIRLYDSCQILLAPSRGGGFELNVLEALARGLVTITSTWPAITEYADGALFIRSRGKANCLPDNPVHIGYGVDPDPEHAYELINYALDNLDYLKKKAEKKAPEFREKYTWAKVAEKISVLLK